MAALAIAIVAGLILTADASAHAKELWLTTRKNAEHVLPRRFPNIGTIACAPDRSSRTRVFATVRYWQRFWCSGRTRDRLPFQLRFEARGLCVECWTITHLKGVGVVHLRVRHP